MSRTFALTLKRPHESLGIPMPMGRKLSEAGKTFWFVILCMITLSCLGVYIYEVNQSATRGFELRTLETRAENLRETVTALENQTAQLQTMRTLEERVQSLGYVPVDQLEFLDSAHGAYALAK